MLLEGGEHLIVGVITAGAGLVFYWTDRGSMTSRALALCLSLIGGRLLIVPFELGLGAHGLPLALLGRAIETAALISGIEWARRIGLSAGQTLRRTVQVLFRVGQGLVLLYGLMQVGYFLIAPDQAATDVEGVFRVRWYEVAIFAPVLGTASLLSGIAIIILLFTRSDPTESVRLRALLLSAPILLSALVVDETWVPLILAIGLLVFMAGAIRYLILQAQRAQSMSQFLSPEVSRMLTLRGMNWLLRRDRRRISVLICDLRGFTAFARAHDSESVVDFLERYYAIVGDVATAHGGMVKDHAGDGVLVLVGAPVQHDDAAERAVHIGRDIRAQVGALLRQRAPGLGIGIGIATGVVTVGAIQASRRLEYVAVGTPVNLASRLCQRAADGEVLTDAATREALGAPLAGSVSERPPELPKGFSEPVAVYALADEAAPG
ncbi:MAG: adenylate/guanylate cyclase domain-containing protein [Nevskiales bacterium]|nr:adenylate/guanylate cyclase domain-containing protein [Nevskiales bacterium]